MDIFSTAIANRTMKIDLRYIAIVVRLESRRANKSLSTANTSMMQSSRKQN